MANHLTIYLSREDRRLFALLCQKEFRPPDNQVRFMIRSEATRQGILPTNENSDAIRQDLPVAIPT
jgi:hypothetical protein